MSKVLITGAAGFVGNHLIENMKRRKLSFIGTTRRSVTGLERLDPTDQQTDWQSTLKDVSTIVHLAARVHVMQERDADPLNAYRYANVTSTLNLAKAAADAGVRRFVYLSSIKVNGERTEKGQRFSANDQINPQGPYAISKAEAEERLFELGAKTGLQIVVIRPPLIYGQGVGGNFRSLMTWASRGLPSPFARIRNARSLLHVDNLCDLIIRLVDHPHEVNKILLASDRTDLSTHEILTALMKGAGRRPTSLPIPGRVFELLGSARWTKQMMSRVSENLQVDDMPTTALVGWTPILTLQEETCRLFMETQNNKSD